MVFSFDFIRGMFFLVGIKKLLRRGEVSTLKTDEEQLVFVIKIQ
jgi:hypothetical protein